MDSISRASTSKFRRITSAVGTILFIAQGGESAKGTNRTLGKHRQKNKSSVGAALSARAFVFPDRSAAPKGAQ